MKQSVALIGKRIDEDVGPAIVIVVGEVRSHTGEALAILVIGDSGTTTATSSKLAVVEIVKQLLGNGVVGDEDIGPAVAVVVIHGDAKALAGVGGKTAFLARRRETCRCLRYERASA